MRIVSYPSVLERGDRRKSAMKNEVVEVFSRRRRSKMVMTLMKAKLMRKRFNFCMLLNSAEHAHLVHLGGGGACAVCAWRILRLL